jgi:hypothetical protein
MGVITPHLLEPSLEPIVSLGVIATPQAPYRMAGTRAIDKLNLSYNLKGERHLHDEMILLQPLNSVTP